MPIKENTVQIPGVMVQYMPTGWFKNWNEASDYGAPDWVGAYLQYIDFDYTTSFKIIKNETTQTYAIVKKSGR